MAAKFFAGLAATTSAVAVVISFIMVGVIFNDINTMYDDVMEDMREFKLAANDAWQGILHVSTSPKIRQHHVSFMQLVGRNKRDASCNCAPLSNACPPGPPGAAGYPGSPGADGKPGRPGNDGAPGDVPNTTPKPKSACIKCPAGPPGPPGPVGEGGLPGIEGNPGEDGFPGHDGFPGVIGQLGEQGPPGEVGQPGLRGHPGQDGRRAVSPPGAKGAIGAPGAVGHPGERGPTPPPGPAGEPGPVGPEGEPGKDGSDGEPGKNGGEGGPGRDQGYCRCPPRSNAPIPPAFRKPTSSPSPAAGYDSGSNANAAVPGPSSPSGYRRRFKSS